MLVLTRNAFQEAVDWIKQYNDITIDLETTGLQWWVDEMVGIAVEAGDRSFYFPFRHQRSDNLDIELLQGLRPILSDPAKTYLGFNVKFDFLFMLEDGFSLPLNIEDSMLAAHLLNENGRPFALKDLSEKYIDTDAKAPQEKMMAAFKKYGIPARKGLMCQLPAEDVYMYAEQDVNLTRGLRNYFVPYLHTHQLYDLWQEVNAYERVLTRVEHRGVLLDLAKLDQLTQQAEESVITYRAELEKLAGYPINPNSPKQLQAWLGIPSTRHEELVLIQDVAKEPREDIEALLMYRGWQKMLTTYYRPFMVLKDKNNRIHPSFKLHGTVTGRLSASRPNLQAIPKDRPITKVKDSIVAPEGYTLVQADLSQAELRVGCHYADEMGMGELLKSGQDIHQATADQLSITRQAAKAINFGILYGMGSVKLARNLRIPVAQAKNYLARYHHQYPRFRVLYQECEARATREREIRLWTGRRRLFRYVEKKDYHKAIANLVQGSVAEILRVSMTKLDAVLSPLGVYMVLNVHDSVLFEVPDNKLETVVPMIQATMEDPETFKFKVPVKADIKVGKRLGELKDWVPELARTA